MLTVAFNIHFLIYYLFFVMKKYIYPNLMLLYNQKVYIVDTARMK